MLLTGRFVVFCNMHILWKKRFPVFSEKGIFYRDRCLFRLHFVSQLYLHNLIVDNLSPDRLGQVKKSPPFTQDLFSLQTELQYTV